MYNEIIPLKLKYMSDLIRLGKPTGFILLMWPCLFGLANIPQNSLSLLKWYVYFFIGSFLMRSAGCVINDLVDINIDRNIERTSNRPLASKKITILESVILLLILLLLSLLILINFNIKTIILGFASIPLIILYPYLKRFTFWPQLGLGIVFNWGVLIVAVQFFGLIPYDYLLLYLGCIFWTIAYDTIYAYQDLDDDIKNNIKSTAVLFGIHGHKFVKVFYTLFLTTIGLVEFYSSKSFLSLIVIITLIIGMNVYLNKWKLDSKKSCYNYFNFNNLVGLFCFIFLISF